MNGGNSKAMRTEKVTGAVPVGAETLADLSQVSGLREAAELAEYRSELRRYRLGLVIGLLFWVAFGLVDWMVVTFIHPGSLSYYWGIRGLEAILLASLTLLLFKHPDYMRGRLFLLNFITCTTAAVAMSLMALEYDGIASYYCQGISIVILLQAVLTPWHWRKGLIQAIFVVGSFPFITVGAALFLPESAAQLRDSVAVATLIQNLTFLVSSAIIAVYAGHAVFSLRKTAFESKILGRYRLKRCIDTGGMGEIWIAYHGALKQEVAIKILRTQVGRASEAVTRFEREVEAMTSLRHPNTVRIFDFGVTSDGLWYFVMELLEGKNLRALVEESGPMEPARAIHIIRQASGAIAEAHARGIVHRDIKPENLFLTHLGDGSDFVKVLDFGIARFARQDQDVSLTQTGWVGGSPAFMSPEAVTGKVAGFPADVYALGAVLHFLVCGRPPFEGRSPVELMYAHVTETPPALSDASCQELPPGLERLVQRCLEKEPDRRFGSAAELTRALEELAFLAEASPLRSISGIDRDERAAEESRSELVAG